MRGLCGRRWSPGGAAGRLRGIGSAEAWRAPDARQGDPLLLFPARHGLASRSLVSADPTRRRGTRARPATRLLARGEHVIHYSSERSSASGARLSRVTSRREDADLTSGERAVQRERTGTHEKASCATRRRPRKGTPKKAPLATRLDPMGRCSLAVEDGPRVGDRGAEDEPSKGSTRVRA